MFISKKKWQATIDLINALRESVDQRDKILRSIVTSTDGTEILIKVGDGKTDIDDIKPTKIKIFHILDEEEGSVEEDTSEESDDSEGGEFEEIKSVDEEDNNDGDKKEEEV